MDPVVQMRCTEVPIIGAINGHAITGVTKTQFYH